MARVGWGWHPHPLGAFSRAHIPSLSQGTELELQDIQAHGPPKNMTVRECGRHCPLLPTLPVPAHTVYLSEDGLAQRPSPGIIMLTAELQSKHHTGERLLIAGTESEYCPLPPQTHF